MLNLALFCLRAAYARAARTNARTCKRYLRAGRPAAMDTAVEGAARRARSAKEHYFNAKWEAQRAGLSRLAVLSKGKSYAAAA